MTVEEFTVQTKEGEYDISARVMVFGEDVLVSIWGGEKPHIGAVAMAQPRPSLEDPEKKSATASVFTYLGHKEDELVKSSSEMLAARLNAKVVVTAGIHWDNLSADGIQKVISNCSLLLKQIVAEFKNAL